MGFGKSLELFFVNGKPDQIVTARMFGWTGHVLKAPRTQIKEALSRPEAQHVGVYLLLGRKDDGHYAYIGESECLADRIGTHDVKKEWWDTAILVTTAANEFNKAHVKYLESRLIQEAKSAKSSGLENATNPPPNKLSEAAVSNMEEFLDTLSVVLPALGGELLTSKAVEVTAVQASVAPTFTLVNKKHGITATAQIVEGAFTVRKGSQARKSWEGKGGNYKGLHEKLMDEGILAMSDDVAVFTTDYQFDSPSAAAAVCHGRSANGRTEWQDAATGATYDHWEASQLKGALT